jgi:hypothetical protein
MQNKGLIRNKDHPIRFFFIYPGIFFKTVLQFYLKIFNPDFNPDK